MVVAFRHGFTHQVWRQAFIIRLVIRHFIIIYCLDPAWIRELRPCISDRASKYKFKTISLA